MYQDSIKNCQQNNIPKEYHTFYFYLKYSNQTRGYLPVLDVEESDKEELI